MRILIIDDTELNIKLLKHLFKKIPEYESIAFTNPIKALLWCRDNEPDLVIVDDVMPEMDGIQFTQQFRGFVNHENTPVLMITANNDSSIRQQALSFGVTDFLNKPLDNIEFITRARNMLALRQCQKMLIDQSTWQSDEVSKSASKIKDQEREATFCLANAVEYRMLGSNANIQRVAYYSKHIARMLGLSIQEQELILEAAALHDIGNLGVPEAILLKTGDLTTEEFEIIKQHTVIGYDLLNTNDSQLFKTAAEIALTHHEQYDGNGYPYGLSSTNIPLFGRIVAVADAFDALTSNRPYRSTCSVEDACEQLENERGKQFDAICVDAFFSAFEEVITIKNTFSSQPR